VQVAGQRRVMRKTPVAPSLTPSLDVLRRLAREALLPWGYELVDLDYAAGLIRVFIDWPPERGQRITIDDCEHVSRQLEQLLIVANLDYRRLEISSPGLDRPLKTPGDFERFQGSQVRIRLRELHQGRRQWEGKLVPMASLELAEELTLPGTAPPLDGALAQAGAWALLLDTGPRPAKGRGKARQRVAERGGDQVEKAAQEHGAQSSVLCFRLDELESARLVPQLEF